MPFGSFVVYRREPRPGKKEPAVPEAAEEKMEFRDLNDNHREINVLLYGRSMSAMQEFLCAVSENMSRELHKEGLTFYTTELNTINDIIARKKKLESFFWVFSREDWCYSEEQENNRIYKFHISPSGMQNKALDMVLHCCIYDGEASISFERADAVWYLADGTVMDENVVFDPYREFLKDEIYNLSAQTGDSRKSVCLLLSQIEKYGHFGGVGEQCMLKKELKQGLINQCREKFPSDEKTTVAIIPVQIYGGLEYTSTDANGNPVLRLSESGYYQSYIPENCQIPGLYTIGQIAMIQGIDFFGGDSCGGMRQVVRRHLARKKGESDWQPDML